MNKEPRKTGNQQNKPKKLTLTSIKKDTGDITRNSLFPSQIVTRLSACLASMVATELDRFLPREIKLLRQHYGQLSGGIAELVNHQEIQNKLRHKLDTVLGYGVQVTEPEIQKLPYLQAVVKETLRLRMAISLLVAYMNLQDTKLGSFDILVNARVGRRICPGIILALLILGITIGLLVQNFELLPPPGQSKIDTTEKERKRGYIKC
ncbi:hypothetical protein Q3G72_017517 [Acer saccharum]|nr:hypothetical protein Q3G72_017517 [Acer saccharum]